MAKRVLVAYFALATGTVGFAQATPSAPSPPSADTQPRASILCGTPVVQPDPSIDPTFAKTPPSGTFTLRTLQPPVCRDMFASPPGRMKQRLPTIFGPKR